MNTYEKAIRAIFTGRGGEYMVAAQILMRGMNVAVPAYDVGVDLIVILEDYRLCRLQVKTARMSVSEDKYTRGIYFYPLRREKRRAISNTVAELKELPPFSETCDIVVFHGVDENRFWIVPATMLDGATGLGLGAPPKKRWMGDLTQMREMQSLGYSLYKIGKHYGLQAQQVKQLLLDPNRTVVEETLAARVRRCENWWDCITNFGQPGWSPLEVLKTLPDLPESEKEI